MNNEGHPIIMKLILLIIVTSLIAGCIGGSEAPKKKKPVESEIECNPLSGWISSPEASGGETTFSEILETGEVEVLGVEIEIIVYDWDDQHSETDEGSDPDTLEFLLNNGSIEVYTDTDENGIGYYFSRYYDNTESIFLNNINVTVIGAEFGDGVYETGPFGQFPIPFREYDDQGAGFELSISLVIVEYK